jgi:predicted TIM-barrel fold metal-dependent hydrolase
MNKGTDSYRFETHHDLARLPYFELRGQRLVLADPSLGPSVDMHTHLANAYFISKQMDLLGFYEETDLWLPMDSFVDLDCYANQNVTTKQRSRMVRSFFVRSVLDPVGGGMRRSATIPNLLRDMGELGIAASLILPIDWPVISHNAETQLRATRCHAALPCFGSVHPFTRDQAGALDRQRALGAKGIKLHPNIQMVRPDHPAAMRLQRLCADKGMIVLWHCGPTGIEDWAAQQRSQVRFFERPIAEIPHGTFVLGHAGALQAEQALDLARRYPNVYLELSCQSLTSLRRILDLGPRDRLVMGSDWPMYHQAIPLAKLLILTEGDEALRRQVLYGNAARLLGLPSAEGTVTGFN